MNFRRVLTGLLMALMPAYGFAQGKGKGNGKNKAKSHKAAKVSKPDKASKNQTIKAGKNNRKQDKTVRVRNQRTDAFTGFTPKNGPPPWAPAHGYRAKQHVYFPDYHVFYDPYRGGYSYWQNNTWNFSPTAPGFLGSIDLGKARIQLLGDVPLTTKPELYYNRYSEMYPARSVNIIVPVPGR